MLSTQFEGCSRPLSCWSEPIWNKREGKTQKKNKLCMNSKEIMFASVDKFLVLPESDS